MDTTRISFGEMVAAISGAVLLIVLFFPWYGAEVSVGAFNVSASDSFNAWQAFGLIDLILFLVAITAIGLSLMRAMGVSLNLPQPPGLIIAAVGAIAVLLILFRLINTPGDFDAGDVPGVDLDISRKIGIFLGLLAAIGVAVGGWLAMNETPAAAGPGAFGGPGAPGTGPGAGPVAGPGDGVGTPPPATPDAAPPPTPGSPGGPAPPPPPPGGP